MAHQESGHRDTLGERIAQPGFSVLLAVLLFVVQPLIPTKGTVGYWFHWAFIVAAIALALGGIIWYLLPWGLPRRQSPQGQKVAEIDQSGKITVYGVQGTTTGASPVVVPSGWGVHAEVVVQPVPQPEKPHYTFKERAFGRRIKAD